MRSRVDRLLACVVTLGLLTAPHAAMAAKQKTKHSAKKPKKPKKLPEKVEAKPEEKPAESPKSLAKAEADKATISFKLGRFDEALTGYMRAYEIFQASGLLFNIGQCHRQLGNAEKAVFFFTGYLRDNPDAANAEAVAALIEEEKKKLERAAASAPASQPAASSAPIVLKEAPPQQANAMLPMTAPGVHTQWWFWTILVAGAAVVATAVALAVIFAPGPPPPATSLGALDRAR